MQSRHRLLGIEAMLVLGLLMVPDAGAQSTKKKIIILGHHEKSAVISGVSKPRQRLNAKDVLTTAKQRKEKLKSAKEERAETKKRIKAQLADVDAVAADFSEQTEGDDDDGIMVESALEAGVPVVLQNASSAKMAKLTGVGVKAGTAVIESTEGGGQYNITLLDGPDLKVKATPARNVEPPTKLVDENKAQKKSLDDYDAKQKAAAKAAKASAEPASAKLTDAQKTAHVEKIISEKPFKKGAKRHSLTGTCDGGKCKEYTMQLPSILFFSPPDVASTSNSLEPVIEWGVYKTVGQDPRTGQQVNTAYVVTRAAGRANLAMAGDDNDGRGYYLDSWNIEFAATYPNSTWRMEKAEPENANRQATVEYGTGFSVGVTPDLKALNFGYSSSTSTTMNTEEFGITRTTTPNSAAWLNKMQIDGMARPYTKPEDLFIWWAFAKPSVATLPKIARQGTDFHAEAVWTGTRDASCGTCDISINGTFTLQLQRAWVSTVPSRGYPWRGSVQAYSVSGVIPLQISTSWPDSSPQ